MLYVCLTCFSCRCLYLYDVYINRCRLELNTYHSIAYCFITHSWSFSWARQKQLHFWSYRLQKSRKHVYQSSNGHSLSSDFGLDRSYWIHIVAVLVLNFHVPILWICRVFREFPVTRFLVVPDLSHPYGRLPISNRPPWTQNGVGCQANRMA